MKTSAELYKAYVETKSLIIGYPAVHSAFRNVDILFEDKKNSQELSVMVFGIYNAGKSTLINALLGSDTAPTGDIPLTSQIQAYQWNSYSILDTPGIDAPLEHEQITKAQMMLADAVIFVVNPSGAAEEAKTLSTLIDLISEKKKVFLVFNDKNQLSQDDFIRLKNETRTRLQTFAVAKGVSDVLVDIPILRVNAASALKGKLTKKKGLVELSGILELETALEIFFSSISQDDIESRLANSLKNFLNQFIVQLTSSESDEVVRHYQELFRKLVANQNQCRTNIKQEITRGRKNIATKSKFALLQHSNTFGNDIKIIYQTAGEEVVAVINDELQYLMSQFDEDVKVISELFDAKQDGPSINDIPRSSAREFETIGNKIEVDKEALTQAVSSVVKMAKPEHIIGGLKLVKDWAPSLMKGIGPKTMEKWAGQVIGKWIPYAGAAVTVISSVYNLFSEDSSDKQMREHEATAKQELERYEREVDDTAEDLAKQFEHAMNQILRQELEPIFKQMLEKVELALSSANEIEKNDRFTLMSAQNLLSTIQ